MISCAGETRDTAELGLIGAFLSDNLVPQNERVRLFRTWGSGIGMLPIGGPAVWGNVSWAPDDTPEMAANNLTFGRAQSPCWNACIALLPLCACTHAPCMRSRMHHACLCRCLCISYCMFGCHAAVCLRSRQCRMQGACRCAADVKHSN
jgi:hypothetical protein